MHEEQTVDAAGVREGTRLVLEHGAPPLNSQMTLRFCVAPASDPEREVVVDVTLTVDACLNLMKADVGFRGG